MTNQEFNASYQLLKQVTDGEARTFHALAATGAVVMVHMLGEDDARGAELVALIDRLPLSERDRVLSVTDIEGAPVVVTRFLLEFSTLRRWLESVVPPEAQRAPVTDAPATDTPQPSENEGSFTGMFRAVGGTPAAEPAEQRLPAEPTVPHGDREGGGSAARPAEPGEFTRMFRTP
ncbi:MAG: hypothetical protein ACRELX_11040, partial [Longimicrobiales bacterium]